ncbi:MAG: hypothetical protein WCQ16_10285 [Verrucomicrobiae bacterium]
MEQLVILVIIGLISLVNWLIQRSSEIREQRKHEREQQGIPEGNPFLPSDEKNAVPPRKDPSEEMRKLMEALGVPVEEPPLHSQIEAPPQLPPAPAFVPLPSRQKPPAAKKTVPGARPLMPPQHTASSRAFSDVLRSRGGVRQAIVLREILGPPKAFR